MSEHALEAVNTVEIRLIGEKLSYQDVLSEEMARAIVRWIQTPSAAPVENILQGSFTGNNGAFPPEDVKKDVIETYVRTSSERVSPQNFLQSSGATTIPEKITALGMYMETSKGVEVFTSQNILDLLIQSKERKPKNFSRDFNNAVRTGYIDESTQKGEFYVTGTGREAVASRFTSKPSITSSRKPVTTRQRFPDVRPEVEGLSIAMNKEGLSDYNVSWSKSKKILWIFGYANESGIHDLSPKEVESISRRLRDTIDTRVFTSANSQNMAKGYLKQHSSGFFELQQKGMIALQELSSQE